MKKNEKISALLCAIEAQGYSCVGVYQHSQRYTGMLYQKEKKISSPQTVEAVRCVYMPVSDALVDPIMPKFECGSRRLGVVQPMILDSKTGHCFYGKGLAFLGERPIKDIVEIDPDQRIVSIRYTQGAVYSFSCDLHIKGMNHLMEIAPW